MLHDDGLTEPGWADSGYAAFDEVARRVSAGSNGVIFTPWLNGERCPVDDGTIRAGFHNLSLRTTREDMVRALFEGVAFNARWMLEAGQRVLRRRLGDIRFLGGGAASDVWCQIHADVLDRRVVRVADPFYANVRGAALFAGLVLGELDQREVAGLVSVDAVFEPDPAHRKVYDELYREFPRLYRRLRRVHARLNRR
jgi:xylulokinase